MNFKKYRELAGLKANVAASTLGIKPQTLYKYENGLSSPSIETFLSMCALYSVDPFTLMEVSRFPSSSLPYMASLLFALDKVSPLPLTNRIEDSESLERITKKIDECILELVGMVRSLDESVLLYPSTLAQYEEVLEVCRM